MTCVSLIEEDDDQEFDGEGIAWEDGGGDRDGDGGEGIDESVEFEVDNDADEEPEERRVRALRFYAVVVNKAVCASMGGRVPAGSTSYYCQFVSL